MKAIKNINVNHVVNHLLHSAQCLKKHIYTIHEGHKDFKCESCKKLFSKAGNLKKHIRRVHEDIPKNP